MKRILSILFLLFTTTISFSQFHNDLLPRVSPDRITYQKIGYTGVEIQYGSPSVNDRAIWGQLVPYNKIWRAGANDATTINFTTDVVIDGHFLPLGEYSFFIIPKENSKWTIIFNKNNHQWGAFLYNKAEDALRIEVMPRRTSYHTENLSYSIQQLGYEYGSMLINWEYLEIEIPFETNYSETFKNEVNSVAEQTDYAERWVIYLQGAEHLEQMGIHPQLAMEWINKAETIMNTSSAWKQNYFPRDYVKGQLYWTKAKLLAEQQQFTQAINYVKKLKVLPNNLFYTKQNQYLGIEKTLHSWENYQLPTKL